MLIKEVCIQCAVTKKAIEYYEAQNLIHPVILKNGYRDFNDMDIEQLKKISVLRKLDLSITEIKLVLADPSTDTLKEIIHQKEVEIEMGKTKQEILNKLGATGNYQLIQTELHALEQNKTISEKLLNFFPGYYGRFLCLHFSSFLKDPIITTVQQKAFEKIVEFLDNAPNLVFPEELQEYIEENTSLLGTKDIIGMTESIINSITDPTKYMADSKEGLEQYIEYKKSDDYKNSYACKLLYLMKDFCRTSGYYDVFIPAMRKLSASYDEYLVKLNALNEIMMKQYPEIQEWDTQNTMKLKKIYKKQDKKSI